MNIIKNKLIRPRRNHARARNSRGIVRRRSGFTMVEAVISAAISVLVIGGALGAFIYGLRTWRAESIKSELHQDLEKAMEHIRYDLRLSSVGVGLMAFYPTNTTEYTAISFPLSTPTTNGLLQRDMDTNSPDYGRIIWNQTVIYHVRPGSPDELLRTVYSPRNTNATADQYYTQLRQAVASSNTAGLQSAALTGESVESRVIFQNLVSLKIRPPEMQFDGYAPSYRRERNLNWGSVVLGDGIHDLTFTVVNKNPSSSGFKVGIDYFSLSPSASRREGELFWPPNSHPADPFYQVTNSGGSIVIEDMSAHGAGWNGNCQLTYTPGGSGSAITFKVHNDLWCDAHFDSPPGVLASNASRKCDYSFTNQNPYIADFIVDMDNGTTWTADRCTDAGEGALSLTNDATVTNIIYGVSSNTIGDIMIEGARTRLNFEANTNGQLFIDNVSLIRADTGASSPVTFGGNSHIKVAAGGNAWSDWLNFEMKREKTCKVRFQLKTEAAVLANAKTWTSSNTNWPMSYLNGVPDNKVVGLSVIEVRYPSNAVYRSGIFDTRLANPTYRELNWTHVEPSPAGDIDIRVRSGDKRDLSDACAWYPTGYFQSNPNNNIAGISGGRYVQYEVLFSASGDHTQTAKLRDLTINWAGATGLVDLVVGFARGPDYGIVKAEVNGKPFIKGIEVEMEIFKSGPFGTNHVAGLMEVRPLNTGR